MRFLSIAALAFAAAVAGAGLGWSPAVAQQAAPAAAATPTPPGRQALEKVCSACHGLDVVESHRDTHDGWDQIVALMIQNGANPTPAEREQIVAYLATTQPPKP